MMYHVQELPDIIILLSFYLDCVVCSNRRLNVYAYILLCIFTSVKGSVEIPLESVLVFDANIKIKNVYCLPQGNRISNIECM